MVPDTRPLAAVPRATVKAHVANRCGGQPFGIQGPAAVQGERVAAWAVAKKTYRPCGRECMVFRFSVRGPSESHCLPQISALERLMKTLA